MDKSLPPSLLPSPGQRVATPASASERQILEALWSELQHRLAQPLQVSKCQQGHRLTVLNLWTYTVDSAERRITLASTGTARLPFPQDETGDLPLVDIGWPQRFLLECQTTDHRLAASLAAMSDPAKRQVVQELLQRSRKHLRTLHAQIQEALALDKTLWKLCLCVRWPKRKSQDVSLQTINTVWGQLVPLRRVARENPGLLRLYYLASVTAKLTGAGPPLRELKACCRKAGLRQRFWAMLCKHGDRVLDDAWRGVPSEASLADRWEAVITYAKRLQDMALTMPLSRQLRQALARDYVDPGGSQITFTTYLHTLPIPALQLVIRAAQRCTTGPQLRSFIQHEFYFAAEYLCMAYPMLDHNQKRAGWPWVMRHAAQWHTRMAEQEQANLRHWHSVVPEATIGNVTCLALSDSYMLWEEACAMRNCVASYVEKCLRGESRIYSLRDKVTGQRLATAELTRDSHHQWTLNAVRGFANSSVGQTVTLAAMRLSWLCQHQRS